MKEKTVYKHVNPWTGQVVTLTVSEELNKLIGKNLAPTKLKRANEFLRSCTQVIPDLSPNQQ